MITGTVVVFIPHIFSISISRSFYFVSFSIVFKEVFLSVGMDISINRQVLSFLSFTTMSGLFALISLSVLTAPLVEQIVSQAHASPDDNTVRSLQQEAR